MFSLATQPGAKLHYDSRQVAPSVPNQSAESQGESAVSASTDLIQVPTEVHDACWGEYGRQSSVVSRQQEARQSFESFEPCRCCS